MKNLLLSLVVVGSALSAEAQVTRTTFNPHKTMIKESPVVLHNQPNPTVTHQHRASRGQVTSSLLHSERIGSAGNLLSVLEGNCNQLDVNDSLNLVTFIHRNDDAAFPGTNLAQYRYDVSKDRGNNWTSDIGPITNDPIITNADDASPHPRFPQAGIYNPTGNTIADSAYLVYSGTFHNSANWIGQSRGRGLISGDISSYNVNFDAIPTASYVGISTSFCHGAPGVFWNLNREFNGTFTTGDPQITSGLVVEKGVWNTITKEVDWTQQIIPTNFVRESDANGTEFTIVSATNIAFDPTGQYGWIACLGDITEDADSVYDPIFWNSTDFGATWSSTPIRVDLSNLPEIMGQLGTVNEINQDASSGSATSAFDGDLVVDAWGHPHFQFLVGNGTGHAIEFAGFDMWDLTYDTAAPACMGGWNGWHAIYLDSLHTLSGNTTSDATPYTEYNRPMASLSPDGKKAFFFWTETDFGLESNAQNNFPNLYGRGIDIEHYLATRKFSYTEGDSLWGAETLASNAGIFGGARYGTASPVALHSDTTYNVPVVLTQIDYNADLTQGLGLSDQPAAFWYINNINFVESDFKDSLCNTLAYTAIHEAALPQNINMFPNPTTGKTTITVDGNTTVDFTVAVYNVLGETVLSETKYKAGISRVELNLTNAASGMYLVKIQSNNGTTVKHLTIEQK